MKDDLSSALEFWGKGVQFGAWWYRSADFVLDGRAFHAAVFDTGEEYIYDIAEMGQMGHTKLHQGVAGDLEEAYRLTIAAVTAKS